MKRDPTSRPRNPKKGEESFKGKERKGKGKRGSQIEERAPEIMGKLAARERGREPYLHLLVTEQKKNRLHEEKKKEGRIQT